VVLWPVERGSVDDPDGGRAGDDRRNG